jgi:hypothetical protein
MGCPPNATTAPSVDILVRVLRLLKLMATVCPASDRSMACGTSPVDLITVLCLCAFRTSAVSSEGVRSAMDSKLLGAKGDVCGVVGEYVDNE